jgi:uncharacterized protein YbjT (DUF2867 family)
MILVIGATGNVGGQVLTQLLERGIRVRAMTRDPASARLPEAAEVVRGDLADPDGLRPCLEGVDAVFLMWPFHDARPITAIVETVKRHARRVVLLSSGAVRDGLAPDRHTDPVGRSHAEVERVVRHSGLAWPGRSCGRAHSPPMPCGGPTRSAPVTRSPGRSVR